MSEQFNNNSMRCDPKKLTDMLEGVRAGLASDPWDLKPYDQMMITLAPFLKRAPQENKKLKTQLTKLKSDLKHSAAETKELDQIRSQYADLSQKYVAQTWKWRDKEEKAWAKKKVAAGTDVETQCDSLNATAYDKMAAEYALQTTQFAQLLAANESLHLTLREKEIMIEYLSELVNSQREAQANRQRQPSMQSEEPAKEMWEGSTIDCESLQEDMKYEPIGWILLKEPDSEEILQKNCEGDDEAEDVYYSESDKSVNPETLDLLEDIPAQIKQEQNNQPPQHLSLDIKQKQNTPKDKENEEQTEVNSNLNANIQNDNQMFMVLNLQQNDSSEEDKLNMWKRIKNFFSLIL